MCSLVSNIRNAIIFIFVFMFSQLAFATGNTVTENTVINFYKAYLSDDSANDSSIVSKYVYDELMKSINDSSMCNYDSDDSVSAADLDKLCAKKQECKEYKGNYLCDWYGVWVESDVNYFTKSQDVYPSWKSSIKTSTVRQDAQQSVIDVVLGEGTETSNSLQVTLKEDGDDWKISSVTE
ncbi:DUF3828 domain-containing protein [Buttiauxella sp. S04-F03]|uniref:DUF3828 domain-containing protein n=1 Tax=Buttiauxella sp. S04-F03 TaxID=2904525 RepID=UPI001E62EA59|nr:DUF3828 domain-containing protein [Buttiauxella sp. S04-F03]